jgi:hypothetical protein
MTPRLNGWQRLWIVISVLYLLPIVAVAIITWPTAPTTWHRDEFITRMPAELRAHVDAAYDSEYAWNKHHYPGETKLEAKKPPKGKDAPLPPGFVLLSAPVSFPNGAVLDVRAAKEGDAQSDARVARAYWAVVEAEVRATRWTMVWQMALVWLAPCLTLYALGWAAAWVRRGFRNNASGPTSTRSADR